MRTVFAALLAVALGSPALAGDRPYIYSADEPIPLKEQIRRNNAHLRQAYDLIVAHGGCNADFNTVEYATDCHYGDGRRVFGAPQMGSEGN
jgi:hypothetical protein